MLRAHMTTNAHTHTYTHTNTHSHTHTHTHTHAHNTTPLSPTSISCLIKSGAPSDFFAVAQSAFSLRRIMTASSTVATSFGGVVYLLKKGGGEVKSGQVMS